MSRSWSVFHSINSDNYEFTISQNIDCVYKETVPCIVLLRPLFSLSLYIFDDFEQESMERHLPGPPRGGVAGATAPGPGPRQGPVKIKLCFSIICFCDIIELGPARGPEESNFHLVRSTLH